MALFAYSSKFNPAKDIPDLSGKVAIVTGGNSGLGYATVQHLARHGMKVYMAACNKDKADAALERLHSEGLAPGNGKVVWLELELGDPRLAKKSAEEFLQKETRLDILVNNAARMLAPYTKSHDGVQDVMMINHIGHFLFTKTLLPLMTDTAKQPGSDVRIVQVSSGAHLVVPEGIRYRNIDDFNQEFTNSWMPEMARYGLSKLANILITKELQRRLDADNIPIIVLTLNPGGVNTGKYGNRAYAARQWLIFRYLQLVITWLIFATPSKGAYTQVFAAASPEVRANPEFKGAYLEPPGVIKHTESPNARNMELAKELWETTEAFLEELGV